MLSDEKFDKMHEVKKFAIADALRLVKWKSGINFMRRKAIISTSIGLLPNRNSHL